MGQPKARVIVREFENGRPDKDSSVNHTIARRRRLADAVDRLDAAIRAGEVEPTRTELKVLARLCYEAALIEDVIRVRRWALKVSDV